MMTKFVPQDQALALLSMRGLDQSTFESSSDDYAEAYKELSLDKPNFYFSIHPSHYPKNSNNIIDPNYREFTKEKIRAGYNYKDIAKFIELWQGSGLPAELIQNAEKQIQNYTELNSQWALISSTKKSFSIPSFRWHGVDNQYHLWLSSSLSGTFGLSMADGKPALQKAKKALSWTLSITIIDIILSLLLGILIGVYLAYYNESRLSNILSQVLYFFYSMPLFWFATLMILFFTSNQFGSWTNIFPSVGIDVFPGKSTFQQILLNFEKLILPIFCLVVHSLAYTSRFVRRGILTEMDKEYIMTAYSKGLNKKQVMFRHALPNALIPVITMYGSVIPGAFTYALILEVIFNIPGFGRLLFTSIGISDWNVTFCILMIVALVTVLSFLLVDILYAFVNPKLRFSSKES